MADIFETLSMLIGRGQPIVAPSRIDSRQVGEPRPTDFDPRKALETFENDVLIYRSAMGYMTHGGSIPLSVQVRSDSGWVDVTSPKDGEGAYRLAGLLENPSEDMTYPEWCEFTMGHLMVAGEAFSRKILSSKRLSSAEIDPETGERRFLVSELEIFIPYMEPVPGSDGHTRYWKRRWIRDDPKPVPSSEMVFFRMPKLRDIYRGLSPVKPVRDQVDVHGMMMEWGKKSFDNRVASELHFQRKGPVHDDVIQAEAEAILSARRKTPYRPFFSDDMWEVHQIGGSRTAKDMDFSGSLPRIREEILSGGGTPPVVAGYFDNATLANAQVSLRAFFRYYLIPAMVRIRTRANASLVPHFGPRSQIRLALDTANVRELVDDLEIDALTLIRLQQAGIPFNEAIKMLNLKTKPIPGVGDEPHGLVPAPKSTGGADERKRDGEQAATVSTFPRGI